MKLLKQPFALIMSKQHIIKKINEYDKKIFLSNNIDKREITEKVINRFIPDPKHVLGRRFQENQAFEYFFQVHDSGNGERYLDPIDMKGTVGFRLALNIKNIDFDLFRQKRYFTYVSKAMRDIIAQFDVKVQYLDVDDSQSNDFFRAKDFKCMVSNYMTDGIDLERSFAFLAPTNLSGDGIGAAERRPWPIGVRFIVWKEDFSPKHHIFSDIHHWELIFSQEIVAAFKEAGLSGYDVVWLDSEQSLEEISKITPGEQAIEFMEQIAHLKRNPRLTPYKPFEGERPNPLDIIDQQMRQIHKRF